MKSKALLLCALHHAVLLSRYFLQRKKVQKCSNISDGLSGAAKAQQWGFITSVSFFLGIILVFLHTPTKLQGEGFLLTSFTPLQSRHGDLGYHLTLLCNKQAKTGTSSHEFFSLEERWELWPFRITCFPWLLQYSSEHLQKLHQTGTQDRRQDCTSTSWGENTLMNFDWSFCGYLTKGWSKSLNSLRDFNNSDMHFSHKSNNSSLLLLSSKIIAFSRENLGFQDCPSTDSSTSKAKHKHFAAALLHLLSYYTFHCIACVGTFPKL